MQSDNLKKEQYSQKHDIINTIKKLIKLSTNKRFVFNSKMLVLTHITTIFNKIKIINVINIYI